MDMDEWSSTGVSLCGMNIHVCIYISMYMYSYIYVYKQKTNIQESKLFTTISQALSTKYINYSLTGEYCGDYDGTYTYVCILCIRGVLW